MVAGYLDGGQTVYPVRWFSHETFADVLPSLPGGGEVEASNVMGETSGVTRGQVGGLMEVARWSYEGNLTVFGTLGSEHT